MLKGKKVYLDSINKSDIKVLSGWYSDTDFLRCYDYHPAIFKTYYSLKKMYLKNEDRTFIPFAVRENDSKRIIGLAELFDISYTNRFSWLSIGFGEVNARGKGYGSEALSLLIHYAFNELNLEKLMLNVISYNYKAIALYEKLGFSREGTYRKAVLRDGIRYDMYLYGLMADEFKNEVK